MILALVCTLTSGATLYAAACRSDEPLAPPGTVVAASVPVVADSNCSKVFFKILSATSVQTTFPNRATCSTTGLVIIKGPAATWAQSPNRRLSLFIRILNKSTTPIQLPVRLFLPTSGTTVIAPAGTPASKVVAQNPDSSLAGGKLWLIGGTATLAAGDSTVLDTVRFTVQSPVTQAKFAFQATANSAGGPPVPLQPPDTVPAWFHDDTSYANGGNGNLKRVVSVLFRVGATQAERQAAIDATGGVIIGGKRLSSGDGVYDLLISDDGSGTQMRQALQTLKSFSQVETAFLNYRLEPSYLRPQEGAGWQKPDWQLNPDSASGPNWGLEQVAAPLAWGCSIGDTSAHLTAFDHGFDSTEALLNARPPIPPLGVMLSPIDTSRHGTRVSSILAAAGDNGVGITGMMWRASLGLVDHGGNPDARDIAAFIEKEGLAGTHIVNLSLQRRWQGTPGTAADSAVVDSVLGPMWPILRRSLGSGKMPLVVIAAGNSNFSAYWSMLPILRDSFPANVVVVGASARSLSRWAFSNFGPLVDLYAPGDSLSALAAGNVIRTVSATSFAAPLVTGAAGLLKSFDARLAPNDLRSLLLDGADSGGRTISGQSSPGNRLLNVYASLKLAAKRPGAPLCGNRVVMKPDTNVYVERTSGDELLGRLPAFLSRAWIRPAAAEWPWSMEAGSSRSVPTALLRPASRPLSSSAPPGWPRQH